MVLFFFSRILNMLLPFIFNVDYIGGPAQTLHKWLTIKGSFKPFMIRFLIVLYMDLLIGGYINTDNDYLLAVPANWGPGGYLSFGDQLSVLLGYFFYFVAIGLPFVICYLCHLKSRAPFMDKSEEIRFD